MRPYVWEAQNLDDVLKGFEIFHHVREKLVTLLS